MYLGTISEVDAKRRVRYDAETQEALRETMKRRGGKRDWRAIEDTLTAHLQSGGLVDTNGGTWAYVAERDTHETARSVAGHLVDRLAKGDATGFALYLYA